jgi:hypothetical protein
MGSTAFATCCFAIRLPTRLQLRVDTQQCPFGRVPMGVNMASLVVCMSVCLTFLLKVGRRSPPHLLQSGWQLTHVQPKAAAEPSPSYLRQSTPPCTMGSCTLPIHPPCAPCTTYSHNKMGYATAGGAVHQSEQQFAAVHSAQTHLPHHVGAAASSNLPTFVSIAHELFS